MRVLTYREPSLPLMESDRPMSKQPILVLNGPNLNLLGQREPEVYGRDTLADVEALCRDTAGQFGFDVDFRQSNAEHELIEWIHGARGTTGAIVINPAALTHTSVAVLDALNTYEGRVIEVHISNVHKREAFRHHSYVSGRADAVIVGCGVNGYALAMRQVAHLLG